MVSCKLHTPPALHTGEDLVTAFDRLVAGYHDALEQEGVSMDVPAARLA